MLVIEVIKLISVLSISKHCPWLIFLPVVTATVCFYTAPVGKPLIGMEPCLPQRDSVSLEGAVGSVGC